MKKVFLAVLLLNLLLFAFLRWGGTLTHDGNALSPTLHAEQIKLLGFSPPAAPSAVLAASAPAAPEQPASAPQPAAPAIPESAVAAASAPAATHTAKPLACLEWGEFSGADLSNASDRLATLKLGAKLSKREVEHSIGYWVYIPPVKDHAKIDAHLAQLKKLGIHDFFIVQEKGKWQNAISLNIFKTEEMARKFLDHLKSKGFKGAVLGERQTRLKFTVFFLKNPSASTVARLTEWQKDYSGIEIKSAPCN